MNTKNIKSSGLILASVVLLSACSNSSSRQPTMAETAAAARSVEVLNSSSSYQQPTQVGMQSQYGNIASPVVRRTSYQATSSSISVQDTLDINVFKVPDLSAKALKVETNGAISMPLIGSVNVAGLSIIQAEQVITQKLTKFMQDPKVSIIRTDKAITNRVTVEGEVKTPGVFPIKGNLSFLQAIAMAQGLSDLADSSNVLFYRNGGQHRIDLDLVRTGQIPDPVLRGDDKIVVLKDRAKVKEKKVLDYLPAVTAPFSILGGFL